ncbi:MAG TPA: hypothetical protein VNZ94_01720 [Xanthobacteraceae bacterium]|nr:hypothetical protein [Xanthobacteraceae bacterium]
MTAHVNMAVIKDGVVVNVIVAEPGFTLPGHTLVEAGSASIGWTWDGEEFSPPPTEPLPVPQEVSRRQLLTGLALVGWITEQEAMDALATGARPASVDLLISQLPEAEQFPATMKWIGFSVAYRNDAMVLALADLEGKSPAEVDDFFRLCAGIE